MERIELVSLIYRYNRKQASSEEKEILERWYEELNKGREFFVNDQEREEDLLIVRTNLERYVKNHNN